MEGIIFDIQRFSIHDGPGIRTNIFFKGCGLRCVWCHNPESQSLKPQLMFYSEKCTGCGKCTEICQKTFTAECTACGKCVEVCPAKARRIAGKIMSADEIVKTVLRDKAYYETSGGGITLTGGEPLLQADFALDILKKCKENGIDTAMETAAYADWKKFEMLLPYLDHVLCDIKCIDDEKHRKLTGVSNKLILENAQKLKKSAVDLKFRMPVIPTLNDDEIKKAGEFAEDTPLELLAYHTTGTGKYAAIGTDYRISEIEPPSSEAMHEAARKYGCIFNG